MTPARVIVADPPWPSKPMSICGGKQAWAGNKYKLMSLEEIKKFPLPSRDEHTVLFMWRLASMQEAAIEVCKAWGFNVYGELVWNKLTKKGKQWFGMGLILRGSHETCLIGTSKHTHKRPVAMKNVRSSFSAPYTGHSAKPDRFYEIVETLYPQGPLVELFARRERPGWKCYGNELAEAAPRTGQQAPQLPTDDGKGEQKKQPAK